MSYKSAKEIKQKTLLKEWSPSVDSALMGMALMNTGLVLLEGHRVIMRRDHRSAMKGKVKIIGGGGAGLEPAEIGYVGPGMLTAAVVGDLFTCPKSNTILIAIRELALNHPDGILILCKNYSGDRLNFGLALERATQEKITIKMLVIGDDGSEWKITKNGRKGLAGSILVYKIAGAMAEAGKSLDDIFTACRDFCVTDLSTVGLTLSPSLYFQTRGPEPQVKDDEMTIGFGPHGQSGVKEIKLTGATEAVRLVIDTMTHSSASTKLIFDEHPVAVLVNNLGSSPKLEEYVVAMEVMKQLSDRGVTVKRHYMGTFMPSLDSQGFSVSILKLTCPETIKYLDAPTEAPAWPRAYLAPPPPPQAIRVVSAAAGKKPAQKKGQTSTPKMPQTPPPNNSPVVPTECDHAGIEKRRFLNTPLGPTLTENGTLALDQITSFAAEAIISCERQLNTMDSELGDGDTGTMLRKGAEALKEALRDGRINLTYPFLFLMEVSDLLGKHISGTIGALYNVFFSSAAKVFQNATKITHMEWTQALRAGVKAIKHYGKADIGDRSMLDVLCPAVDELEGSFVRNLDPAEAIYNAAATCEYASEKTKNMTPIIGRANRPKKPVLYPDPGAHAASIWFRAVSEAFDPDQPAPKPSIFLWTFLNEEESDYVLKPELSKRDILLFLDQKLETEDPILETLLYQTIKFCRGHYYKDSMKTSALLGIVFFSHVFFIASRWRSSGETYEFFRESILRHSIEEPPIAVEIFHPLEVREALLFYFETYIRNLPLTRLLCVPHYKLRLEVEKEPPPPPPEPETPGKHSRKK